MEPWPATAQLSRPCRGTVLETRGQAEERRPTHRLRFSLDLQAEGPDADVALSRLQARLAAVRSALRTLATEELEVTSPSTWNRPAQGGRPAITQARLRLSGRLAPERLQALVRDVGTLEGVRLSPVSGAADASLDAAVRRQVIEAAYRDALALARDMAAAIGRSSVEPLEMGLDGREFRPVPMRAMDAAAPPPFNPDELPPVKDRLSLRVRFCAT